MKMKLLGLLFFISLLIGCNSSTLVANRITIEDPEHHIKDSPDILKFDSVLYTGWYLVSENPTGYRKQLLKTKDSFNIEPTPILTASNFDKVYLFHEKDCWALITWLDKKGSQTLNEAIQKDKGRKLAFILDNKLLRLQNIGDSQFARVGNHEDPRVYGHVLTFPCNYFSPQELENYETIIKSEK